ncbi:MAG: glycosyltransferase family 87 protein [Acidobacteriota bacterium]
MSIDKFHDRLPKYRILSFALIVLTIAVCSVEQMWYVHWGGDPRVFVHAARLMLSGQDIINLPTVSGLYYVYPPFFAFLNIPLVFLPIGVVIVLWTITSVVLLGWSTAAFYAGMMGRPFFSIPQRTRWIVISLTLLLTARFIFFHLQGGQSNIFVLTLAVVGLRLLARRQDFRAGIAIGLSIILKITTAPFVFWFLARQRLKVLIGIGLGGFIGVVLPALVVGIKTDFYYHREWFNKVFTTNAVVSGIPSGIGNLSLRAQLGRFFQTAPTFEYHGHAYRFTIVELSQPVIMMLGWLLVLAIVLAIIAYAVRYRKAAPLVSEWGGYALVFSLIPSFSTWTEVHHLVLLVPAYLYVVHLWHSRLVSDRLFKTLVVLSFVFLTLTTRTFCGVFLSQVLTSLGFINYGMLFLSASIFRAASCLRTLELPRSSELV